MMTATISYIQMDEVDCKLNLLLALHQRTRRRSSSVEPPSTAGQQDADRQRSRSETCTEQERDTDDGERCRHHELSSTLDGSVDSINGR